MSPDHRPYKSERSGPRGRENRGFNHKTWKKLWGRRRGAVMRWRGDGQPLCPEEQRARKARVRRLGR